jgi:glycosyltransferase involved in cell wall biosynthesis
MHTKHFLQMIADKNQSGQSPLLSIVIPMYNEAESIDVLFSQLTPVLQAITSSWEIICINDGSTDGTLAGIKHKCAQDSRVKLVSLSRNFGKEAALTAGLAHSSGQAVIPFDADLQDPPEVITEMVTKWKEGHKVVLATRKSRRGDSLGKRFSAFMYYKLLGRMSSTPIPPNTGDFRLMDRQVVNALQLLPERTRFMKGLFAWAGFSTVQVYFDRPSRNSGKTKQGLCKLWQLAKDGLFSFTTAPLRMTTYLGIIISFFAFSYAGWLLVRTIIFGVDVPGYASIMASVLCMGGVQLVCLGIMGEYLGRVYQESKQRPLFIVEETLGLDKAK